MRVFVTGATGLLGSRLVRDLIGQGDAVVALSRRPPEAPDRQGITWLGGDPRRPGRWMEAISGCDAVVHLAGEPIAGRRWSAAHKRRLVSSRIDSTRCVVQAIELAESPPRVLVCASATGIYGPRGEEGLDESSAPGDDFLSSLCARWEAAARTAERWDGRVVCARIGVVLSSRGGALPKLIRPFRLGLGGPLGPARNYFSWLHEDDAIGLLRFAITSSISGPLNVVAPGAVRMGELARSLGRVLRRPAWLPTPLPLLRIAVGELADHLSPGQRVVPALAVEHGYTFHHPNLEGALRACLDQPPTPAPGQTAT